MFLNLAESARRGDITDGFIVVRGQDGSYADMYYCDDLEEMIYEIQSAKIRARVAYIRSVNGEK